MAEQLRLNIIDNEIKAYLDQLTSLYEDHEEETGLSITRGIQLKLFRYFKPKLLEELAKERPTGLLGRLYDEICKCGTNNPRGEIERMADDAFYRGIISDREHTVLKYRIPFHGIERETLEKVGVGIIKKRIIREQGICGEAVRHLEATAYGKLYMHYIKGVKYRDDKIQWPMGY